MESSTVLHRYEQVAQHVRQLVSGGTYRVQERLPSVRALSRQLAVSITTVVEAYRLLEDQGVVEARPQSGYYVAAPAQIGESPRGAHGNCEDPIEVGLGEFLMRHLRDFQRLDLVQFGSACPCPSSLPSGPLGRALAKVIRENEDLGNRYDLPPGCEALRVQIARRSLSSGCLVSPDEVVLTLGCQEALTLCLRATCEAGDTVAVETPTFYGHLQAIEMLGLKALEIPVDPVHGISLAALSQALDEIPVKAMLASPNFSNPTGAAMSPEDCRELLEILGKRGIPLIEDDIFGELAHSGQRPPAARSYDERGLVLLCSSFSKTLAPGYRVGWIVAPQRYLSRLQQLKMFTNLGSPAIPAMAIAEFLRSGGFEHHLRQCRRLYARQVHQMADAIERYFPEGTHVTRPRGGYVLWVHLPVDCDTRLLYPHALQAGMTFGPGPIFSARGRFRNCMRLCAPYWSAQTEPVLLRLGELIKERTAAQTKLPR